MIITYTAGDSEPTFQCTVYNRDGNPLDMSTAASVEFRAKVTTGSATITRAGAITSPSIGLCTFTWTTTDLATVGIYNVQVRVYWTGTTRWSSHPNNTYDALVIIREVES